MEIDFPVRVYVMAAAFLIGLLNVGFALWAIASAIRSNKEE